MTSKEPTEHPKLGKDFLSSVNPWTKERSPDSNPEDLLSDAGREAINDIRQVFIRSKFSLVESKGESLTVPIFFGMTLDEYLEFIKPTMAFDEEYKYVSETARNLQILLDIMQHELLTTESPEPNSASVGQEADVRGSSSSRHLLNVLEGLRANRNNAFIPSHVKQKGGKHSHSETPSVIDLS